MICSVMASQQECTEAGSFTSPLGQCDRFFFNFFLILWKWSYRYRTQTILGILSGDNDCYTSHRQRSDIFAVAAHMQSDWLCKHTAPIKKKHNKTQTRINGVKASMHHRTKEHSLGRAHATYAEHRPTYAVALYIFYYNILLSFYVKC